MLVVFGVTSAASAQMTVCDKAGLQYRYENPNAKLDGLRDVVDGQCVLQSSSVNLTQAQVNALVAAYDTRVATEAAEKTARAQAVGKAFLDLKALLKTELNIDVASPSELRGKMAEVNAAAEAKIQAATSVPQIKGVMKLLFTYIVLVDRREDIKE
jgi:hypothetical protein